MLQFLIRMKNRTLELHFAREKIAQWSREHLEREPGPSPRRILDIGLGGGGDLKAIRDECAGMELELHGLESKPDCIRLAKEAGIHARPADIERDRLPFDDETFDIVLANHVIEHTKELFWIFSEISRVVKKGGLVIIGCPNLASWHNRLALLFGKQPPCMKLFGAHLRGITKPGFKDMIEHGDFFKLVEYRGTNFYPLPPAMNKVASAILPTLAASHHFVLRRTSKPGRYIEVLETDEGLLVDTPYFRG